jgi:hypothetical protein
MQWDALARRLLDGNGGEVVRRDALDAAATAAVLGLRLGLGTSSETEKDEEEGKRYNSALSALATAALGDLRDSSLPTQSPLSDCGADSDGSEGPAVDFDALGTDELGADGGENNQQGAGQVDSGDDAGDALAHARVVAALLWHAAAGALGALRASSSSVGDERSEFSSLQLEFARLGMDELCRPAPSGAFDVGTSWVETELFLAAEVAACAVVDGAAGQFVEDSLRSLFGDSRAPRRGRLRALAHVIEMRGAAGEFCSDIFRDIVSLRDPAARSWTGQERRILFHSVLGMFFDANSSHDRRSERAKAAWKSLLEPMFRSSDDDTVDTAVAICLSVSDAAFFSETPIGFDIRGEAEFWRALQSLLEHRAPLRRARALSLLQKVIEFSRRHNTFVVAPDGLFWWGAERDAGALWAKWRLVYDTLEEANLHLIQPLWKNIPSLVAEAREAIILERSGRTVRPLHRRFLCMLFEKGLSHNNPAIRRWLGMNVFQETRYLPIRFFSPTCVLGLLDDTRLFRGEISNIVRVGLFRQLRLVKDSVAKRWIHEVVRGLVDAGCTESKLQLCVEALTEVPSCANIPEDWAREQMGDIFQLFRLRLSYCSRIVKVRVTQDLLRLLLKQFVSVSLSTSSSGQVTFDPTIVSLFATLAKLSQGRSQDTVVVELVRRFCEAIFRQDTTHSGADEQFEYQVREFAAGHFTSIGGELSHGLKSSRALVGTLIWLALYNDQVPQQWIQHTQRLLDLATSGLSQNAAAHFRESLPVVLQIQQMVNAAREFDHVRKLLSQNEFLSVFLRENVLTRLCSLVARARQSISPGASAYDAMEACESATIFSKALTTVAQWGFRHSGSSAPVSIGLQQDACQCFETLCRELPSSQADAWFQITTVELCAASSRFISDSPAPDLINQLLKVQLPARSDIMDWLKVSIKAEGVRWRALARCVAHCGSLEVVSEVAKVIAFKEVPGASRERMSPLLRCSRACITQLNALGAGGTEILLKLLQVLWDAVSKTANPRALLCRFVEVAFQPDMLAQGNPRIVPTLHELFSKVWAKAARIPHVSGALAHAFATALHHSGEPTEECVARSVAVLNEWNQELLDMMSRGYIENEMVKQSVYLGNKLGLEETVSVTSQSPCSCSSALEVGAETLLPIDQAYPRTRILSACLSLAELVDRCDGVVKELMSHQLLRLIDGALDGLTRDQKYVWHNEEHRQRTRHAQVVCLLLPSALSLSVLVPESFADRLWKAFVVYNHKSVQGILQYALTWFWLAKWRSGQEAVVIRDCRALLFPLLLAGRTLYVPGEVYEAHDPPDIRADLAISACTVAYFLALAISARANRITEKAAELTGDVMIALARAATEHHAYTRGTALNLLAILQEELMGSPHEIPSVLRSRMQDPLQIGLAHVIWDLGEKARTFLVPFARNIDATTAPTAAVVFGKLTEDSDFPDEERVMPVTLKACFGIESDKPAEPLLTDPEADPDDSVPSGWGVAFQQKVSLDADGTASETNEQRHSLVVVASLVDRLPNLGGLTRTGEVFAIERLVIPNREVLSRPDFLDLAMTAERLLPIQAVKPSELKVLVHAAPGRFCAADTAFVPQGILERHVCPGLFVHWRRTDVGQPESPFLPVPQKDGASAWIGGCRHPRGVHGIAGLLC